MNHLVQFMIIERDELYFDEIRISWLYALLIEVNRVYDFINRYIVNGYGSKAMVFQNRSIHEPQNFLCAVYIENNLGNYFSGARSSYFPSACHGFAGDDDAALAGDGAECQDRNDSKESLAHSVHFASCRMN